MSWRYAYAVTYRVTVTDRSRQPAPDIDRMGPYNTQDVIVTVLADDDTDPSLVAHAMVAGLDQRAMVLEVALVGATV